jgi:8-oxo-dGTP diphosphatase
MKDSPHYQVVAAVIEREGKILCAQRGPGRALEGKWEFPGGKVEGGETRQEALIRELREELSVRIVPGEPLMTVEHRYPDFGLTLHAYRAAIVSGEPVLGEHRDLRWLAPRELSSLNWAEADMPIVERLTAESATDFSIL